MASDATTQVTTPAAKKAKPTKPAAKKSTAKKSTAKKSTATKATAKKATATKTPRKAPAVTSPSSVVAALPAFVASVPGLVASAIEDLGRIDLRSIELPSAVEVPALPEAVVDFAEAAAKRGSDLAAAAAKRGAETVSSVQHGVVLVREAVGL